jgi:hypothetical protein
MSFPGSIVFLSLVPLGAGVLLAACNGKVLSLGTNSTPPLLVYPADVSGTVTACGANAAHPNVCCTVAAGQDPSCVTYPEAPFTQCESAATTYPDPRSCCPLDGGSCTAPPSSPLVAGLGGGSSGGGAPSCTYGCPPPGCDYTCPPGLYVPPNPDGIECCTADNALCSFGDGPPPPECPACPAGWQVPQGEPALCCMTDGIGAIECFSQAGPAQPTDVDGGAKPDAAVPTPVFCAGGPGGDGCLEEVNGHYYTVNCPTGTNVCSCIVGTNQPASTFPYDEGVWEGVTGAPQLFASCGFPAPVDL